VAPSLIEVGLPLPQLRPPSVAGCWDSAHHVFMVVFCDEPGRKARGEVIWGRGVDNAMNGVVVTNGYKTQTLADV
jgi:hypothetical protein